MRGIPLHQNPVAKHPMMDCALRQVFTSLEDLFEWARAFADEDFCKQSSKPYKVSVNQQTKD